MTQQSLLEQAADLHRRGALGAAEKLYRQILSREPGHVNARYMLGILRFQQGRGDEALINFDRVLAAEPGHRDALYNRATALAHLGRTEDAAAGFDRLLAIDPRDFEALYNRGTARAQLKQHHAALGDFDRALALTPDHAPGWSGRANALRELGRLEEALQSWRKALALAPDYLDAQASLGLPLFEVGRIEEGMAEFRKLAEMKERQGRVVDGDIAAHVFKHDAEQLAWRRQAGDGRDFHILPGTRLAGTAVNPDRAGIAEQWRTRRPQIVVIDDLLSQEALQGLRKFCLESTVWRSSFADGYMGAFPENGFACPLLAQVAEEFRAAYPAIFADYPLLYLWAFKYDSSLKGIKVHADFAAVNVNFWITPDEANNDPESGGLRIWDVGAPSDWDFAQYNGEAGPIRDFLASKGAKETVVPYRANRAVIFDSELFHETDRFDFKPGYENRRINITMLYGRRAQKRA
jgi:tetratricopeptide (TPR) repeat protein